MRKTFLFMLLGIAVLALSCGNSEQAIPADEAEPVKSISQEAAPPEPTADASTGSIKAADFTLKSVTGEDISLSDYAGKVVILDFWATWCPPCRMEIPHFNDLAKEYGDKGLVVLGVSVDRGGADVVRKFKEKTEVGYPVVMSNSDTHAKYQSYIDPSQQGGIPFTFVIDREGIIRERYVGYRDKEVFENAIKPLL